jgi:hypothetical protein
MEVTVAHAGSPVTFVPFTWTTVVGHVTAAPSFPSPVIVIVRTPPATDDDTVA